MRGLMLLFAAAFAGAGILSLGAPQTATAAIVVAVVLMMAVLALGLPLALAMSTDALHPSLGSVWDFVRREAPLESAALLTVGSATLIASLSSGNLAEGLGVLVLAVAALAGIAAASVMQLWGYIPFEGPSERMRP